jgi:transcriptional regulator with XRE-family HTH domain
MFPSEAVARNVRSYRLLQRMTQEDLASRMTELGLDWSAGTVGFVERYDRAVTVDEYAGLVLSFGVTVGALLDPTGPLGTDKVGLDLVGLDGQGVGVFDASSAHGWATGAYITHWLGPEHGNRFVSFRPGGSAESLKVLYEDRGDQS